MISSIYPKIGMAAIASMAVAFRSNATAQEAEAIEEFEAALKYDVSRLGARTQPGHRAAK